MFDDQGREIAQGGATYFTYRNGPVISPIFNIQNFDNYNFNLVVMPKFSIQNARNNKLTVVAYFFFQNGMPVKYYNSYSGQNTNLTFSSNFIPGFENTTYNYSYYSDLFLNVSYNYFPILNQNTSYKYYTALFMNGVQIATSSWTNFNLNR